MLGNFGPTANYLLNVFSKFITTSEKDISKELYMDVNQVKDLYDRGYLGTHGKSHKPLATLNDDDLHSDIKSSMDCIENICGGKIESITYPYGEKTAVDSRVGEECESLDLVSGFTMFRGLNNRDDIIKNPLMLKRFDTNEAFGGKSEGKYRL